MSSRSISARLTMIRVVVLSFLLWTGKLQYQINGPNLLVLLLILLINIINKSPSLPTSSTLSTTHYNAITMGAMASQITSLAIVYATVYSDADKKNIKAPRYWPGWGIPRGPVNSPHKWPVTRKMVQFDDIIMHRHHHRHLQSLCMDCPFQCLLAVCDCPTLRYSEL